MTVVYNATCNKICRYYNLWQKRCGYLIFVSLAWENLPPSRQDGMAKKNRPRAQAAQGRFSHGKRAAGDGREVISAGWGREGVRQGSFGK
jgi:hypothetical protein